METVPKEIRDHAEYVLAHWYPYDADNVANILNRDFEKSIWANPNINSALHDSIINFLKSKGFITVKANSSSKEYYLTDKGRKAQEFDSIEEYQKTVKAEADLNETIKKLQVQTYQLQKTQLIVNVWIAIGTLVAAIYYLFHFADFADKKEFNFLYVGFLLMGFILGAFGVKLWAKKMN